MNIGLQLQTPNYNNNNVNNISDIRTPSMHHKIVEQATNALRMQNTTTPLLGGHNVELYKDDWNGVTPKTQSIQTPNINTPNINHGMSTGIGIGGGGYMDHSASVASVSSMASSVVMSDSKRRKREKRKRKRLRSQFENLPAPNYEYEVALPKLPNAPFKSDKLFIEDEADKDKRRMEQE
eukprot:905166_1